MTQEPSPPSVFQRLAGKFRDSNGNERVSPHFFRVAALIFLIICLLAIPSILFGDRLETFLDGEKALAYMRSLGGWNILVGIGLIMLDLAVSVPAHAIMAGFGLLYGPLLGGLLAGIGSYCAGLLGYVLCRLLGQRAAKYIAGEEDIERMANFFEHHGLWALALSRWAPVIPEVLSCLAGTTRMPFWKFTLGSLIGSLSVGFAYGYFGAQGEDNPGGALLISFVLPFLVLPVFLFMVKRANREE